MLCSTSQKYNRLITCLRWEWNLTRISSTVHEQQQRVKMTPRVSWQQYNAELHCIQQRLTVFCYQQTIEFNKQSRIMLRPQSTMTRRQLITAIYQMLECMHLLHTRQSVATIQWVYIQYVSAVGKLLQTIHSQSWPFIFSSTKDPIITIIIQLLQCSVNMSIARAQKSHLGLACQTLGTASPAAAKIYSARSRSVLGRTKFKPGPPWSVNEINS